MKSSRKEVFKVWLKTTKKKGVNLVDISDLLFLLKESQYESWTTGEPLESVYVRNLELAGFPGAEGVIDEIG